MKPYLTQTNFKALFYFFITLFFLILYRDYWLEDPVLSRDDVRLLYPFGRIHDLGEYIKAVSSNAVLDVQPVRDLTLIMNIGLMNVSGLTMFHGFNFLLFMTSVLLFHRLLETLGFQGQRVYFTVLIFCAHPVMVSAVGWISARKHTLALIFILLALLSFLRDQKVKVLTYMWYFLSLLSHQIFFLFPLWVLAYQRFIRGPVQSRKIVALSLVGGFVVCLGVYKTFILGMGNTVSMDLPLIDNISRSVLSLGRSIIILFFPVTISAAYDQGNVQNLLGIPFLVAMPFFFYKRQARESLIWLALAALSFAPTLFTFTNDTYLYLPLLSSLVAVNYYLKQNSLKLSKAQGRILLTASIILLMIKTISASGMWKSDFNLWKYSFENEKSPYTQILLSRSVIPVEKEKGMQMLIDGIRNFDLSTHENITLFFLKTVYTSPMTIDKKIEILREKFIDTTFYRLYFGVTLAEGNKDEMREGIQMLRPILKPEETYAEGTEEKKIYSSLKYLCKNIPGKETICKELSINFF